MGGEDGFFRAQPGFVFRGVFFGFGMDDDMSWFFKGNATLMVEEILRSPLEVGSLSHYL